MKVVVLNGSPKGDKSVTTGYVRYISKILDNEFSYINIGKEITKFRKDNEYLKNVMDKVVNADLVIWSIPVYYYSAPSQVVEFLELISDNNLKGNFKGKKSTFLTTSINFFDDACKAYLEQTIETLNMELIDGIQFKMHDLQNGKAESILYKYANFIKSSVNKDFEIAQKITTDKKIIILSDKCSNESDLNKLITGFKSNFNSELEHVTLDDLEMKSGCLGCCKCGWDNTCVLTNSDKHNRFFLDKLQNVDIIVFAADLKGDFFSYKWKMFFDRNFFVNHAPNLSKKQFLWLIPQGIKGKSYITALLDGWSQMNYSNFAGVITNKSHIKYYANKVVHLSGSEFIQPMNFLGVAGSKIFRDDIFETLRFPFRMDHKHYKKHGLYDFPQKRFKDRFISSLMLLLGNIKGFRDQVYGPTTVMVDSMYSGVEKKLKAFK